ncbi:MAG: MarR family transcriptional regulator [Candidatus Riflebacteria bacterium HGW-Riflebacteria-1]|jgi:MarR family 2-MHQ and catechol resistance regulon transcriptional repressor|nr:MAG: MarR family transcriptional regulator [Candidatus Riflebacteria bacterium HGW-Riflebacteria-1]
MGTHFTGSTEKKQALDCFIKLLRATESVNTDVQRNIQAEGLSESQFGILEALLHLGTLNQNQIAKKLLKSGGNITLVIDNLVKQGLVVREKRSEDRRFYWISLTDKGRRLIEHLFPLHAENITRRMAVLSHEEQQQLGELCRKLGKNNYK